MNHLRGGGATIKWGYCVNLLILYNEARINHRS